MSIICPTVLAENPDDYAKDLDKIAGMAGRIQIDLADDEFAPRRTISPVQAYWPENIKADIHLMFQRPLEHLETLIAKQPHLVVIHAEADGDLSHMTRELQASGIKSGLALLPETDVDSQTELIKQAGHVLIFGGELGHYGGEADLGQLNKVSQIKAIKDVEIGWDGGANDANIGQIAASGVDVINVGGYIQKADDPKEAYAILKQKINA